jgi:hypothetical protein
MVLMLDDLSFEFSIVAWSSGLGLCRLARKEGEAKELGWFWACIPVFGSGVLHQREGEELRGYDYILVYIYSDQLI